ncbi:MAG: hypothetical protein M1814_002308 [Vezdaea aestivalis]|nr:MAG: hypothetical protein M1814_002308 [Vezdaea aestivalis]
MVLPSNNKKMDELLAQLLSFPPHPLLAQPIGEEEYENHITRVLLYLGKTSNNALSNGMNGPDNLLNMLDPAVNSLSFLWVLVAQGKARPDQVSGQDIAANASNPSASFWKDCLRFSEQFDVRQIRFAAAKWRELLDVMATIARAADMPILAVHPIRAAILRLDPESSTFTSNHHLFVSLCLEAKLYRAALPVIDKDIHDFPSGATNVTTGVPASLNGTSSSNITLSSGFSAKMTYQTYLEYYLYGAMAYMYLKKWSKALDFLTCVITAPVGTNPSAIMVEAYKKWVLVGLIHKGALLKYPSQTAAASTRAYHSTAKAYEGVAILFERGEAVKLQSEVKEGQVIWAQDQNSGLIEQTLKAFRKFCILSIDRVYASVQLSTLALYDPLGGSIAATQLLVLEMISNGDFYASLTFPDSQGDSEQDSLNDADPMLRIHGGLSLAGEASQLTAVEAQLSRITDLEKRIQATDRRLAFGKEYLQSTVKSRKNRETGITLSDRVERFGMMMELDEDEDLMGSMG